MTPTGNEQRLQRTAILADLLLGHVRCAHRTYSRGGEPLMTVLPEIMIAAAVAAHTIRLPGQPMSITQIARVTEIPRGTVQHRLVNMMQAGAIAGAERHGYVFDIDGYLIGKVDPSVQQHVIALVARTHAELQKIHD